MPRDGSRFASKTSRRVPADLVRAACLGACLLGFTAACRPAPGLGARLDVRAPEADADADVYVDGRYVGSIEAIQATNDGTTARAIDLAPGLHRVEIRKPGRFPVQRTIRVEKTPLSQTRVVLDAELLENPLLR